MADGFTVDGWLADYLSRDEEMKDFWTRALFDQWCSKSAPPPRERRWRMSHKHANMLRQLFHTPTSFFVDTNPMAMDTLYGAPIDYDETADVVELVDNHG